MKGNQAVNRGALLKCVYVSICVISLVISAIGVETPGNGQNLAGKKDARIEASGKLSLWYKQPATSWMTEALPIGNGPMGYYQAFGDIFIRLGHDMAKVKNYRRQLDIERAICSVAYEYEGVRYQRTAFASHPEHVIVVHLTAQPG